MKIENNLKNEMRVAKNIYDNYNFIIEETKEEIKKHCLENEDINIRFLKEKLKYIDNLVEEKEKMNLYYHSLESILEGE